MNRTEKKWVIIREYRQHCSSRECMRTIIHRHLIMQGQVPSMSKKCRNAEPLKTAQK